MSDGFGAWSVGHFESLWMQEKDEVKRLEAKIRALEAVIADMKAMNRGKK